MLLAACRNAKSDRLLDERDFGFADSGSMSTDAFARYVREEIVKWAKVVKDSGATVD